MSNGQASMDQGDSGIKIFKRLSIMERGHLTNHFTFSPVKEIEISADFIALKVGYKQYRYKWSEVKSVVLKLSTFSKSFGRYARAEIKTRLCVLKTNDRTFTFDLSPSFPDFAHPDELLAQLKKYIDVKEQEYIPIWKKYDKLIAIGLVALLIIGALEKRPIWVLIVIIGILVVSSLQLRIKKKNLKQIP